MEHCEVTQVNRVRTVSWRAGLVSVSLCLYMIASGGISHSAGFTSPEECQSFAGGAHLNCLYSYIERQQRHNDTVESQRKAQQDMLHRIGTGRIRGDDHTAGPDENQGEVADLKNPPQTALARPYRSEGMTRAMGSPVECRAYSGAAHLNCLYAYIEIQDGTARKVEEELKTQKDILGQLREQVDRQAAASQDFQRRFAEQEAISSSSLSAYVAPPIFPGYAYPGYGYLGYGHLGYGYPATGLSLYLGVPGLYLGRPFYGSGFFGPRFYGHHRR